MQKEQTIEKRYQKKTQVEHILIRPDTYVGSIEQTETNLWVLDKSNDKFVNKNISYVPALYKIFDEILVNAADHYQRDHKMDQIRVKIDKKKNTISIWNNGQGIPIQIHKEYKIYVPELVFGHLLAGENFDDTQKKVVGGRNGYGAKLTNIFSKKFQVETANSKIKRLFKMTWTNNMSTQSQPEIESYDGQDYTCIIFEPDLKRFGMKELENDIIDLMKKRVYDIAGILSNVKVYLNEKKINMKGFSQYVELYLGNNEDETEFPKIYDKGANNKRWNVLVSLSDGQFQQVSFVNSICTTRGGTHVNYITEQITDRIIEHIKKKHKNLNVKPFQIKNNLWIFVNCLIENPTFDSQTKETLTLKVNQFGSKCDLSEKFIKDILKSGVIDQIVLQATAKENAKMAKALGGSKKSRLLGIQKLEDANDAGTKDADKCTLIITEGDSAKSLAMAGIEVVGRDRYGVFPLKGKLLNVREASNKQIMDNQEIQNLIKILGLQLNKNYQDVKNLRYGSLMIMSDQDHDGSHIKGLVINFINYFWPSLLRNNKFLKEFVTPLIKATKGRDVQSFFTLQDYKRWASGVENIKQWKIKYYKGLGTSSDKEAKEYFSQLKKHEILFKYSSKEDDEAIDLAFNKKKADDRKEWLAQYDPNSIVDHSIKQLRYKDFINKELIQYSMQDNMRSIPSLCDGLKVGQRKILYACFRKNLKDEIKVAQLAATVALLSAYHHGEQSLAQTIVGMAQNFVGSNNINLLMPIGQFGSRNLGGKEAAQPRYISTKLNKVTKALFPSADEHLYKYLEDDGQVVEPEWYLPIIPMVLVNGAEGIGTGWSTNVPCYNPREIAENLKRKMNEGHFEDMKPYYKGFNGVIEENQKNGYNVTGNYEILKDGTLRITELPIKKWTRDYKTFLEGLMNGEEGQADIEDIREYHTSNRVDFHITLGEGKRQQIEDFVKKFKLQSTIQTTNMVLFDENNRLQRYTDCREILESYYNIRLQYYEKRKEYLISKLERDVEILYNKKKFILGVINDEISLRNVKREQLERELVKKEFVKISNMTKIKSTKIALKRDPVIKSDDFVNRQEVLQAEEGDGIFSDIDGEDQQIKEFDYLLSMPLWSLTYEKLEQLIKELEEKQQELLVLQQINVKDMWEQDIDQFLDILDEVEDESDMYSKNTRRRSTRQSRLTNYTINQNHNININTNNSTNKSNTKINSSQSRSRTPKKNVSKIDIETECQDIKEVCKDIQQENIQKDETSSFSSNQSKSTKEPPPEKKSETWKEFFQKAKLRQTNNDTQKNTGLENCKNTLQKYLEKKSILSGSIIIPNGECDNIQSQSQLQLSSPKDHNYKYQKSSQSFIRKNAIEIEKKENIFNIDVGIKRETTTTLLQIENKKIRSDEGDNNTSIDDDPGIIDSSVLKLHDNTHSSHSDFYLKNETQQQQQ